jgi:hypothetical protein
VAGSGGLWKRRVALGFFVLLAGLVVVVVFRRGVVCGG